MVRVLLSVLVLPMLLLWAPGEGGAASAAEQNAAKHKINVAGRQRMLSQRMSMLSCMSAMRVQTDSALSRAKGARELFDVTLTALRDGDPSEHLLPEADPAIVAQLAQVRVRWDGLRMAMDAYLEGDGGALEDVHDWNMGVLVDMNTAVVAMERTYGEGLIKPEIAAAINIAGRQRMLLMKSLKEACMGAQPFEPQADRAALVKTMQALETNLDNLRRGNADEGVIAPPSFEIEMQLELVQMVWDWMAQRLRPIALGEMPADPRILSQLLYHGEVALREMNAAVSLYEAY